MCLCAVPNHLTSVSCTVPGTELNTLYCIPQYRNTAHTDTDNGPVLFSIFPVLSVLSVLSILSVFFSNSNSRTHLNIYINIYSHILLPCMFMEILKISFQTDGAAAC
ncbi:hypothetical protein F4820DRAFT_295162 [Hypoxylon rubiginosum]|uniref:Uncharacterized protein n=1 Tax=Hypoxylon rubiginosum TaxID=110542 RepID=A0ACB9Z2D0_9PEZI|nr:hypothetical protein F4820DRAFT_295162 [Hypoxylon rubiginosum]